MYYIAAPDVKAGKFAARRAGDPADLVAACDRAHSTLKWQPRFAGGALDFIPNLFRPVIVYPSLEVGAIIRTPSGRFFVIPHNSFE
jgi:hypothetical protein